MKRKINFKDIMKKVVSFVKGHMGLFIDLALALMVFILFYWKGRLSRGALIAAFIVFIYFIPSLIRLITGKKKRKWTKEEKKLAFKKGLIALLSIFIVGIFAAIAFFIFILLSSVNTFILFCLNILDISNKYLSLLSE